MLGTPDNKDDYLNMHNAYDPTLAKNRRATMETLADMDTVNYLSRLFTEPLIVYVH